MTKINVPAKFNGPPASGNGGYSCGVVAEAFGERAAVSLRRPVPLDQELQAQREEDGSLRVLGGGEVIAEAVAAPPPTPWEGPAIGLTEANAAYQRFVAPPDGYFDHCFVCGRARDDGFHVFSGPVGDGGVVASPWTPPAWAADADGTVRPEFVWSVLDCPGYFALHGDDLAVAYLVRQQVEIIEPPRAGVEYVVVGKPLERGGRKGLSATAILEPGGNVLAHGECLLVVPRSG